MSLASLPVELIELICERCSFDDIKALMLTSRHLSNVANDYLLPALVRTYGITADSVNNRDWDIFVEGIRNLWDPPPQEEWEWRYSEGYTDEGAFALWVHRLAFANPPGSWPDPIRCHGWPLCEAERNNEVLLHVTMDSLKENIPKPLAKPLPEKDIVEKLAMLRSVLQRQVENNATTVSANIAVELPGDFVKIMRTTNGIQGAGIPSEIQHLQLVYELPPSYDASELDEALSAIPERFGAVAAWKVGGESADQNSRGIYYVLCRDRETDPLRWKIVLKTFPGERDYYKSLSQLIQIELEHIRKREYPGESYYLTSGTTYPSDWS